MTTGKPNLYLDIDGVLLGKDDPASSRVVLARHSLEFLTFVLDSFQCYWLTTHCKGDAQPVLAYLKPYLPNDLMALAQRIQPTTFDIMKTDALRGDYYWVDDSPLACEIAWLKSKGMFSRWIQVDTRKRPDDLLQAITRLLAIVGV